MLSVDFSHSGSKKQQDLPIVLLVIQEKSGGFTHHVAHIDGILFFSPLVCMSCSLSALEKRECTNPIPGVACPQRSLTSNTVVVAFDQGHFDLVIKVYPDGNVSSHMFGLKVGDMVEVRSGSGVQVTYDWRRCIQ